MVVTITLESDEAKRAAAAAEAVGGRLILVPRIDGRFSTVGTITKIESVGELPNGSRALVVRGIGRARIGSGVPGAEGALHVQVEYLDEPVSDRVPRAGPRVPGRHRDDPRAPRRASHARRPARRRRAGALADTAAYSPDLTMEQRVQLLETVDVEARLELAIAWAREVLADLELKDKIRSEVGDDLDKQQREMLLRRQMDAIRKELDEGDEDAVAEYRTKLAELELPDTVRAAIDKELDRLERMGQQNPEHAWVRNWLDAVFELPWGNYADEHANLGEAREVLDADHEGLDKVKERILEFLAVRVLRRERGLGTVGGTRLGCDPRARRSSGCRQDVTR